MSFQNFALAGEFYCEKFPLIVRVCVGNEISLFL